MNAIERMEKSQRRVYHALAHKLGMSEDERRQMLLDNFGVESSADLDAHQLTDLIHTLDRIANPSVDKADRWRKRLIAAIDAYLRAMGYKPDMMMIKAVACRASGKEELNSIPVDRLKSLYNAFIKRREDYECVPLIINGQLLSIRKASECLQS